MATSCGRIREHSQTIKALEAEIAHLIAQIARHPARRPWHLLQPPTPDQGPSSS